MNGWDEAFVRFFDEPLQLHYEACYRASRFYNMQNEVCFFFILTLVETAGITMSEQ